MPSIYQFMAQHPSFATSDFSRLVIGGVGGAPMPVPLLKVWEERGVALQQGYGMTETSPAVLTLDKEDAARKAGSSGKPVLHTEVRIVRPDGTDADVGELGELWVRGPNVTPGYWNRPDANASSFTDGWLHTGDATRVDEEGFYYIVDRWKDMYISGGENVYPAEVESVLHQLTAIAEAAIIGIPNEQWGEVGMAIVAVKPGHTLTPAEIHAHCAANLARFKCPRLIEFVDALPRNATGKIHKPTLRKKFNAPKSDRQACVVTCLSCTGQHTEKARRLIASGLDCSEADQGSQYIRGDPASIALIDAKVLGAGLAAHGVLLRFERDLLAFIERAQTRTFDGADVNENVGAAIIGLNEAKTLGRVEPLNCSGSHVTISKMRESALPARPPRRLDPISTMSWGLGPVSAWSTRQSDNSNTGHIVYFAGNARLKSAIPARTSQTALRSSAANAGDTAHNWRHRTKPGQRSGGDHLDRQISDRRRDRRQQRAAAGEQRGDDAVHLARNRRPRHRDQAMLAVPVGDEIDVARLVRHRHFAELGVGRVLPFAFVKHQR